MSGGTNKYYALFDYNSFTIRILSSEIKLYDDINDFDALSAIELLSASVNSKYNRDTYSVKTIDELPQAAREPLTHETLHWWQSLSSTFYITRFLLHLKLLRYNASDNGLNELFITDTYVGESKESIRSLNNSSLSNFLDFSMPKEELEELEKALLMCGSDYSLNKRKEVIKQFKNLCYGEELSVYQKLYGKNHSMFNIVSDDPPTAMPYFDFPHLEDGLVLPGYSAILDYFYYINFSGLNIIESATYISEYLFQKKSIPDIDLSDFGQHTYLGIWEFYRRLHSSRYKNQEDLALSFLALVDLTFMNDPELKESEIFDIDDKYVNSSLPYRFGKIVYRAQGYPPLDFSSGNYEMALKNYQDSFCKYSGIPNPEIGLKRMIVYLIVTLSWDARYFLDNKEEKMIYSLYMKLRKDINKNWDTTLNIIDILNRAIRRLGGKVNLGYNIIAIIINALYFRLNNRGKFALPHLYYNELKNALPLPLVVYRGDYYQDIDGIFNGYKIPFEVDYSDLNHDFLLLKVLSPLSDNQLKCGFLKNYIRCNFQKNGAKCPYSDIKDDDKFSFGNMYNPNKACHWSYVLSSFSKKEI